ncbi:glutamate ABC transporter substrate-binding protein [Phytomonospora endophytica]|uniref:Polar amino acid transport system substrate-binding protein n=1 Tax=Phytomonospora endophytica TaxID=714109 RepID=A0A841FIL0_9ACTN|nr:glutamate ABC transporter substrate-binding protein [Phytomonospora endophytica]MBB6033668.1 polar amino acid transport system substrate-binding protein [Phytomonospora endophytica]GIG64815.1 ABC transporter substrate-binding protein [Phytomonospora endophytica]
MKTPQRAFRRSSRRLLAVAVACGVLATMAACGSDMAPKLPDDAASPPMPVGVQDPAQLPDVTTDDSCGDATASYAPSNGLNIGSGSTMAQIKANGVLKVGVDQNTYLFGYRDPSTNDLSGFDVAIAREIARAIFGDPSKIQYKAISSDQRVPFVQQGEVDMVVRTMTMNCARWKDVAFSSEYFRAHQQIAVYGAHKVVETLEELKGERVCAATGSTSIRKIADSAATPVAVPEWTDCLVMLQQGTVDAISTDNAILAGFAAQDDQVKLSTTSLSEEPYGIAISLEHRDLVEYVNAVLEDLRGNGTWAALYAKADDSGNSLKSLLGPASPPAAVYK